MALKARITANGINGFAVKLPDNALSFEALAPSFERTVGDSEIVNRNSSREVPPHHLSV
jgi:hypothetical protein